MTELEATRLKLKCLEMVEGANLKWWEVLRTVDGFVFNSHPVFASSQLTGDYRIALGIVEGKPVWEGDELYHPSYGKVILRTNDRTTKFFKIQGIPGVEVLASTFSWNPPKPKTVMVEFLAEDAKFLVGVSAAFFSMHGSPALNRIQSATSKTLENLK